MFDFLLHKIFTEISLSVVLVVLSTIIHQKITKPCEEFVGWACDYDVGFPFTFWIETDILNGILSRFLFGFTLDILVWFIPISVFFWMTRPKSESK